MVATSGANDRRQGRQGLRTLADAYAYILTLSELEQADPRWQSVAGKLVLARESGDIEAVTKQIELALLTRRRLVLK